MKRFKLFFGILLLIGLFVLSSGLFTDQIFAGGGNDCPKKGSYTSEKNCAYSPGQGKCICYPSDITTDLCRKEDCPN